MFPEMAAHCSESVRKGRNGLVIPTRGEDGDSLANVETGGQQRDEREQTEQDRGAASYGFIRPLTLRFQAEMGAGFFKGDLQLPPADVVGDDVGRLGLRIRAQQSEWVKATSRVTDQHPADRCRGQATVIPD